MRKSLRFIAVCLAAFLSTLTAFAQGVTINGSVSSTATNAGVPSVSVTVKGGSQGTTTDANGNFKLSVPRLPVTLVITSVGFETQEVSVSSAVAPIVINFVPSSSIGQEVVVSATRTPERILEAPVTVERMNSVTLRNVPSPSYYEAIANLKGVDMHTASLTFRTLTTRGFISSGNVRMNQLVDGMDNQAPGLNFSVGSVVGLTELDVDNVELLSGASSALYGSGGMNGTLLINSKNPFRYQGLSYQVKQGIMHISDRNRKASPYYDWSVRWGKAISDKLAFKITGQFLKANDWEAYDESNVARTNVLSKVIPGNRSSDPNYDGINIYGDETSANIGDLIGLMYLGAGSPALTSNVPGQPFTWGYALQNTPRQNVSRTGYREKDLVDYNTINFKTTGGIFYKITPKIEASWNSYFGSGTTVYTGADRYSLRNLKIAQHKLELRADKWFVRGYTTQENAGDAYQATVLGRLINEAAKPSFNQANVAGSWYPQYIFGFLNYRFAGGANASNPLAHQFGRGIADAGRLLPGTPAFTTAANSIKNTPIPKGAKFLDRSDLYSAEGQMNLSDQFGFTKLVDVIVGTQWKQYSLNSQGTIFSDTTGRIKVAEFGGYVQLRKRFFNDVLTLTGAGRYDKHTNFEGRFTPRVTATVRTMTDHYFRASFQTAYRFPTNQDQYINLNTGSAILIGLLPSFQTYYELNPGQNHPGYTAESIGAARAASNPALLKAYTYQNVKPESVSSYELGYKGVIAKKFYFDVYGYYNRYKNFLGRVAVGQSMQPAAGGGFNPAGALNPLFTRNLSYIQNSDAEVTASGWGFTGEYQMPKNYVLYGNVFSDILQDVPFGFVTNFNSPILRYNIGARNTNAFKGIGFNLVYKWQDEVYYEGTFATGDLPSFGWLDAQISYRLPNTKSMFRIGGTNVLNNYQRQGYGSPYVGGLYYASFAYNVL